MFGFRKKPRLDPDRIYIVVGEHVLDVGSILEPDTLDLYATVKDAEMAFGNQAWNAHKNTRWDAGLRTGARATHLQRAFLAMLAKLGDQPASLPEVTKPHPLGAVAVRSLVGGNDFERAGLPPVTDYHG